MKQYSLCSARHLCRAAILFLTYSVAYVDRASCRDQAIQLPGVEEFGKALLADVLLTEEEYTDVLTVLPIFREELGDSFLAGEKIGYLGGEHLKEFKRRLRAPSKITIMEGLNQYHVFTWPGSNAHQPRIAGPRLFGSMKINSESDCVFIRLNSSSPIYPKIDFLYENQGLAKWLTDRLHLISATIQPPKVPPPKH